MNVEFDDLRGEVRAGGVRAACRPAGRAGELRLGGGAGPVLRPVTFGERSAAAAAALPAAECRARLCAALAARATVSPGTVEAELRDVVVLALAGADDECELPFAETALGVLSATGGELISLLDAPAREVDRLSMAVLEQSGGAGSQIGGWTRVELGAAPRSLAELRDRLADALLLRAALPADGASPELYGSSAHEPESVPHAAPRDTARPSGSADAPGAGVGHGAAESESAAAGSPAALSPMRAEDWRTGAGRHGDGSPSSGGSVGVSGGGAGLADRQSGRPGAPVRWRPGEPAMWPAEATAPPEPPMPEAARCEAPPRADVSAPAEAAPFLLTAPRTAAPATDAAPHGRGRGRRPAAPRRSAPGERPLGVAALEATAPRPRPEDAEEAARASRPRDEAVTLDMADALALALHDEADLRGLER